MALLCARARAQSSGICGPPLDTYIAISCQSRERSNIRSDRNASSSLPSFALPSLTLLSPSAFLARCAAGHRSRHLRYLSFRLSLFSILSSFPPPSFSLSFLSRNPSGSVSNNVDAYDDLSISREPTFACIFTGCLVRVTR